MNNWPTHYRYSAVSDEDGMPALCCEEFQVVHETRCTYLVVPRWATSPSFDGNLPQQSAFYRPRRVVKGSDRGLCHPTRELALHSFKARQRWRIRHAEHSIRIAKAALEYLGDGVVPGLRRVRLDDV